MKKLILITFAILSLSVSVFAENSTLHVKGGIQYPDATEKVGLDSAATLNIGVDRYFTVGLESGFGWVQWKDENSSIAPATTLLAGAQVEKTNLYYLPLLAVATVRLADVMESSGVLPYITGGVGYSWTWYRNPDFKDRFQGLTYQAMVGAEFKLGESSALSLLVEAGYRGAPVENSDNIEIKMSGPVARIGISFPLEPSDD